jgi:hypothetical protein
MRGLIRDYAAHNAECFSLADDAVDIVFCKEAFHHLPRPALGFYEMIRISRTALVFIEPIDGPRRPLASLKLMIKRLLRRYDTYDQFEPAGNFIYRLSISETVKMMTALGHPCVAWKGLNNFWHTPFDSAKAGHPSWAWFGTRMAIFFQDVLCQIGLLNYGLATVICFKEMPSGTFKSELRKNGFTVLDILVNPYRLRQGIRTGSDGRS